ncbi:MAG: polymerase sigma-70 factor, subfamily, partial [Mycobacterium sp.]|nr:polymerase sigma-70 factor, subfamily [Mycobacterium sp.]
MVPTICLERPVDIPGLLGGTATEGTVFPTMTDIDESAPDAVPDRAT